MNPVWHGCTSFFYEFYGNFFLIAVCYHESWSYEPIHDQKRCEDLCGFALEKCCYNSATEECMKPFNGKSSLF